MLRSLVGSEMCIRDRCTAMAHAYKIEGRSLDSEPHYKYATGTMTIKYVQPTSNDLPVLLKARVIEVKGKKTTLACEVYSGDQVTVTAEVIAIRVFDSSKEVKGVFVA